VGSGGDGGGGGSGGSGADGGNGGGLQAKTVGDGVMQSTIEANVTGNGGAGGPGGGGGNGGTAPSILGFNGDGGAGGGGGDGGWGAGFYAQQQFEMEGSTVSANACGRGGDGSAGGASGSGGDGATGTGNYGGHGGRGGRGCGGSAYELIVDNSTFSGNVGAAGGDGGDGGNGVAGKGSGGNGGDATMGGGIYVHLNKVARVAGTTLVANVSLENGGAAGSGVPAGVAGAGGRGGGIYVYSSGILSLTHTLLGNNDVSDQGPDCYGSLDSLDYNLIEKTISCTIDGPDTHNIYNQDPGLASLGNNGGSTETHLPLPGSPVLDAGAGTCYKTDGSPMLQDQRGRSRPVDVDNAGGAQCDIGAVEVQGYRELAVTLAGEGQGAVASAPPGVDCGLGGAECSHSFDLDTVVTLQATADAGSLFAGWSGDCGGAALTCQLTMDGPKVVTATFEPGLPKIFLPIVLRNNP
jgi:hypothetical protein